MRLVGLTGAVALLPMIKPVSYQRLSRLRCSRLVVEKNPFKVKSINSLPALDSLPSADFFASLGVRSHNSHKSPPLLVVTPSRRSRYWQPPAIVLMMHTAQWPIFQSYLAEADGSIKIEPSANAITTSYVDATETADSTQRSTRGVAAKRQCEGIDA